MKDNRSLAAEYEEGLAVMEELHDGMRLSTTAARVEQQLPTGRLTLLSTSSEGAAIAAVCAAHRATATSWRLVHLGYPPALAPEDTIVFLEPIDPGRGWQAAVHRHYPEATFIFTKANASTILKAA